MSRREANGILTVVICILTVCIDTVRPEFFRARCCPDTTQRVHVVLKAKLGNSLYGEAISENMPNGKIYYMLEN